MRSQGGATEEPVSQGGAKEEPRTSQGAAMPSARFAALGAAGRARRSWELGLGRLWQHVWAAAAVPAGFAGNLGWSQMWSQKQATFRRPWANQWPNKSERILHWLLGTATGYHKCRKCRVVSRMSSPESQDSETWGGRY